VFPNNQEVTGVDGGTKNTLSNSLNKFTQKEASKTPPNKKRNSQCGHFLQKNNFWSKFAKFDHQIS
jgi:hypothetical protein